MQIIDAQSGLLTSEHLKQICQRLNDGGVIVFPTETVYGLMCRYGDLKAQERIFKIKNRPHHKPLQCLISSPQVMNEFDLIPSPLAQKFIDKFFPGSLTLILENDLGKTFGFRMPDFPLLQQLLEKLGYPLWATSANISGKNDQQNLQQILESLSEKVDLAVKNDEFISQASTLVKVQDNSFSIIREGKICKNQLEKIQNSLVK